MWGLLQCLLVVLPKDDWDPDLREVEMGAWKSKHRKARDSYDHSETYKPWTSKRGKTLKGLVSQRQIDLIDIGWMSRPKSKRTLPFYADASQCASRAPFGVQLGTVCTSTVIYDYAEDTVLSSELILGLLGYTPSSLVSSETVGAKLKRMAGEAVFVPNLMGLVVAAYLNPKSELWPEEAQEEGATTDLRWLGQIIDGLRLRVGSNYYNNYYYYD